MNLIRLAAVVLLGLATAGCELIVDIFQAGMVVGVILVVLIIGVVLWAARKIRRR